MMSYIVAAVGEWNKEVFLHRSANLSGEFHLVTNPAELNKLIDNGCSPIYIFFVHWRWIVPKVFVEQYKCVCFHMTDLPYGRGGSPLQNLILRGFSKTKLTALKMDQGVDSGPVYMKKDMELSGRAEEIYLRASCLSWDMIEEIINTHPNPKPQQGEVTKFNRRRPEESKLPSGLDINQIYDFIRMLDAPAYPKAFLNNEDYRFEFENPRLEQGILKADVVIKLREF